MSHPGPVRAFPPSTSRLLPVLTLFLLAACVPDGEDASRAPADSAADAVAATETPPPAPRFEDYPVPDTATRVPAGPKIPPELREYATEIRLAAKTGRNFAGNYRIVEWGCGSPCHVFVIVDLRTGRVHSDSTMNFALDAEYRRDSRLLVLDPDEPAERPDSTRVFRTRHYVWNDSALVPVEGPP